MTHPEIKTVVKLKENNEDEANERAFRQVRNDTYLASIG